MTATTHPASTPKLPPRWIIRLIWRSHRLLFRLTRGRLGLSPMRNEHFGMLRLRTVGRKSGKERAVIVGYFEDEGALVTLAMNGWGAAQPAWWLNLLANPDAKVDLKGGAREVRAQAATGDERARLWQEFPHYPGWGDDLEAFATLRPDGTAVVVFEPR